MSVRSGAAAFDTVKKKGLWKQQARKQTVLCNDDDSVPGGVGVCAERSHCWHQGTKHGGSRAISTKPCHTPLDVNNGRTTLVPDFCSYFDWHASLPPICAAIHMHREGGCVRGRCGPTCRRRHRAIAARQSIRRDHSVAGRGRGGGCEKQRNGHTNSVALSGIKSQRGNTSRTSAGNIVVHCMRRQGGVLVGV
jgi:hypothetical protein